MGDAAEALVADRLARAGWTILGTNVRVGRFELDIVALDPGPPSRLVGVEVRWRASRAYGGPEETIDQRKLRRTRLALGRLAIAGALPDGTLLPRHPPAVDVVAVEPGRAGASVRHLRDVQVG